MTSSDTEALIRVIALSIANNEEGAEDIVRWAYKTSSPPKQTKRREKQDSLRLPFTTERFRNEWETLRSQPKWKNKSQDALQRSLDKLGKYDERFAVMLIQEAIERGWQGVVFSDTDERYRKWGQGGHTPKLDQYRQAAIQLGLIRDDNGTGQNPPVDEQ